MNYRKSSLLIMIAVMMGTGPLCAGSPPDQAKASDSSTSSSAVAAARAVPATPSPDVLKRAGLAGYRVKKLRQSGITVFCKQEVHLGSRFSTDSCIDEAQLEEFLLRVQSQRDNLQNHIGTSTDIK